MLHHARANVYWYTRKNPDPGEPLSGDIKTRVAIIGGGMMGLSCAQRLHDAGVPVVIVEKDFCGAGASGKTSGFITPDSEIELSSLVRAYGPQKAKRIWEFVLSGVRIIRENIQRHSISCDYEVQDSLFVANTSSGFHHVKKEHEARMRLGYASTLYGADTVQRAVGSPSYAGAVRYPDTFGVNSYLYCQAMRDILRKAGVAIYEQTPVRAILGKDIMIAEGRITADHIIICADRFLPDLGFLKKEVYHVQTFLGISKPLVPEKIHEMFPGGALMVWDTDLVYNYFRMTGDRRLLIGGGDLLYTYARKIAGNTARFGERLRRYIRGKFPSIPIDLEYLWPGMLGVSKDLLPVMGPDKRNNAVWYAGAATGLPWAAALGRYGAERLLDGRDEFDLDFSPDRHFVIGSRLQSLLTTPPTFAISHGIAKYF